MSHNYTFGFTIAGNFALVVVYYIEFDSVKKATLSFTLLSKLLVLNFYITIR